MGMGMGMVLESGVFESGNLDPVVWSPESGVSLVGRDL